MKRNTLCLVAILIAACGDAQPVKVTEEPRPDLSVNARADALKAQQAWEALGIKEPFAGSADKAWARAEQLRAAGDTVEAADAYDESAKLYRGVIQQFDRVKKAAAEAAQVEVLEYQLAIQVQARALALRTQLDSLRTGIADRTAGATGFEKAVLTRTLKVWNEEVFSRGALLAIDTKLETAKALFAGKRYEDASKSYTEAQAALNGLSKRCEEMEARSRAEGHRGLTMAAAERTRKAYESQNLPPPQAARDAFEAAKRGEEKLTAKDYEGATAEFGRARESYDEAHEMAPVIRAERDEATRTLKAAMLARKGWRDYASSDGIDPNEPSSQAEAAMARGKAAAEKSDFTLADKEFRAARHLFEGLEPATRAGVEDQLKAKQKGPAPTPPGKYASASSRHAVRLALRWLARHQDEEGRWDSDGFMKHDPDDDKCDGRGGARYDIGVSGLAMLAFLEAGYSDRGDGAYYAINLYRGLKYLLAAQDERGVYGSRSSRYFVYNHCIATKAMCLAYERTKAPRYKKSAQRAVSWIARARNPDLAWRYVARSGENDTSVTVWAISALDAARRAGLDTDPGAFTGAKEWAHRMTDPEFGQVGYNMPGGGPTRPKGLEDKFPPWASKSMTAAGMTIRLLCGGKVDETILKGIELMSESTPTWNPDDGSIDMYYWYMGTRVFRHPRVTKRMRARRMARTWMKALRAAVVRHQHPKGSGARTGSWDPIGVWGADGGRVYSTALMTLALLPTSR